MSSHKLLKFFISVVLLCFHIAKSSEAKLKVGFYQKSCAFAERIVGQEVRNGFNTDPGVAAGLLRLHFHDCFVRGCDGSVLIDSTPSNTAEKNATQNQSLRPLAFKIIDNAKASLERACPGVVSCADIVAFAARDSIWITGGSYYKVPAGRRDGKVSSVSEASSNVPLPTFNLTQLTQSFVNKGLTQDEMVTLSGAHTLGQSQCRAFANRLYNFSKKLSQDPTLDPTYAAQLKQMCPKGSKNVVPMDPTPARTDVEYYSVVLLNRGLFTSDQTLLTNQHTQKLVNKYANNLSIWENKFAAAMVKMGNVEVLTGNKGTIRTNCRKING